MSDIKANTIFHETVMSEIFKGIAAGAADLAARSLRAADEHVEGKDPLHAERFLNNAKILMEMAKNAYEIGEAARVTTLELMELGGVKE